MIFTSYYRRFGASLEGRYNREIVQRENFRLISISITKPNWCHETCKVLMPSWSLFVDYQHGEVSKQEYIRRFNLQLADISAERIVKAGKVLDNSILLCWEPSSEFCHRHIVAAWLRYNHVECYELERIEDIIEFK